MKFLLGMPKMAYFLGFLDANLQKQRWRFESAQKKTRRIYLPPRLIPEKNCRLSA
jgi:hypothetical protein